MSAPEKRQHGRSPWREAFELIATRPTREQADTIELGQSAAGLSYVKSLHVTRKEDEAWGAWIERATGTLIYAVARLPQAPGPPPKTPNDEGKTPTRRDVIAAAKRRI
jgi:hypothetical protein